MSTHPIGNDAGGGALGRVEVEDAPAHESPAGLKMFVGMGGWVDDMYMCVCVIVIIIMV